jgi:hypothetical protein
MDGCVIWVPVVLVRWPLGAMARRSRRVPSGPE